MSWIKILVHFQRCLETLQQNGQSKITERKKASDKYLLCINLLLALIFCVVFCRYDFYLISQHVRQGTVTPTHYIVVHDKSELKPDYMQRYVSVLHVLETNTDCTAIPINLGNPGTSIVVSQPLDRIPLQWLAIPCNPAMSPHSRHPSTLNESVEERKREDGVGEHGQPLLEKPQNARYSNSSSASCLKTQTATCYAKANRLKWSWMEPCEPALEYVTADKEKVPAKLVVVDFVEYHLTKLSNI